jgi:antitoxin (DNA-binding transcriptional repressor) of toxin-antitoxin stability system
MQYIKLEEAQQHLADLVDAAVKGETILIIADEHHAVRLVPMNISKPKRQFGSAAGKITMSEDFDAPLADFDEYVE